MIEDNLFLEDQRTEEVRHIIERMPKRFGHSVTLIVLILFITLTVFGWIIRYPDLVTGQVTVNSSATPLKLIANTNGKIKLRSIHTLDIVREGQILAYIENPTNPTNVIFIDSLLQQFNPADPQIIELLDQIPNHLSLGELNGKYYSFVSSLQELFNYSRDKMLAKQEANYARLLNEQNSSILILKKRIEMANSSKAFAHKFYTRDSMLFRRKVISESELDKSEINYLASKDALENMINNSINAEQSAQQTKSKLQELSIQKPEKKKELILAVVSSYNDLTDNIKLWEQKYVFRSPFAGKVQFLKFYTENQFVQAGEQVFTVVPKEAKAFGQVILPAKGSGKIKIGQEVIVKLDNFPFQEYGSVTGKVKSISLTTNITKTDKNDIETYMVIIDFPNQLKTNYGSKLDFKAESKGSAEIITNDRHLIERLFDNLKYAVTK
jgi:multidrug efflux pump subunit AcrA (membrane-fusion protein)